MKESKQGEGRPSCVKGDICKREWLDEEPKAPGKSTRGLMRQLVRGTPGKYSEGKEKLKHCLENVGHL